MYLTRFQINPRRRDAGKLLASPQMMHAAVLSSFPDPAVGNRGRVLWRVDTLGTQSFLLIASPEKPDLTHLAEQAGWPTLEGGWESRNYDGLLGRIESGQRWAFRLTGNPVHALPVKIGEKRGKIVAHRTVAHQLAWLEDQAQKHGFRLAERESEGVDISSGEVITGTVPTAQVARGETVRFKRGQHTVTLSIVSFDGLLEVTDAEAFRSALRSGIGPARAYGCGMLTVAPAE